MVVTTFRAYGPKPKTLKSVSARNQEAVKDVLFRIGFTGIGVEGSKIGRVSEVLIGDVIEHTSKEYQGVPVDVMVNVVGTVLDKINLREKISRLVDTVFEAQQDIIKEMAGGKIIDEWLTNQDPDFSDMVEEPVDQTETLVKEDADDIEPVEDADGIEPVEDADGIEPVVEDDIEPVEDADGIEPVEEDGIEPVEDADGIEPVEEDDIEPVEDADGVLTEDMYIEPIDDTTDSNIEPDDELDE